MKTRNYRSDAFWLGLAMALTQILLLSFLCVAAWRTNAVMLFRKDSTPPAAATEAVERRAM